MSKRLTVILFFAALIMIAIAGNNYSQNRPFGENGGGVITGKIFDNDSKHTIEYANIVVFNTVDSNLVTGTVSDVEGQFRLEKIRPGKYLVEVRFLGYDDEKFNVEISREKLFADLGEIYIHPSALKLEDVVVEGERSPVTYEIDKKVLDVSKMQTVVSGNAADILQNVPSVTVDIEGNVSLRGSSNFTVLIDGRPSIISAQDALQQLPATSIDKIEIITNPSAKYDPDGTAGIINVLLKKNENLGLSGIINANGGLKEKYGGDFLLEYKMDGVTTVFGLDYNNRNFPGTSNEERRFITNSSTTFINSDGSMKWGRASLGLRGGLEWKISDDNILNFGARYGTRDGRRSSFLNYTQWSQLNPNQLFYQSSSEREHLGDFYAGNITYLQKFGPGGHELKAELNLGYDDNDETTTSRDFEGVSQSGGRKSTESGPSKEFEGKLDYTLPLNESSKFEAGYEGETEISDENNELLEFNAQTGEYVLQPLFSNQTKYDISSQSLYSMYSTKFENFGLQGGFRAEYTYRTIELKNTGQSFSIDRWDYFPSVHSSYSFAKGSQLMASYTRRIQRPRGWELEPFLTWFDANNVRRGNPDLKPEFIDSYDAGVQTLVGAVSVSADVYYRVTSNKIERVRSTYEENVSLNSVENVGKDYALGSEFMIIFDPVKFWDINLMANVYNYKIEGTLFNEPFSRESFNWSTRMNNVLKLGDNTQLQVNLNYNSPSVSSQGRREGFFSSDISAKQDFFEKKLSLILQIRDLFGTAKYEYSSSGPDFYSYNYFERESPMVMLTARFTFNNYKPKRDRIENGDQGMGGEDF